MLQEVHDLADLLLGPLVSGDVGERRVGPLLVVQLGTGAGQRTQAHEASSTADPPLGTPAHVPEHAEEEDQGEQVEQDGPQHGRRRSLGGDLHVVLPQQGGQVVVLQRGGDLCRVAGAGRQGARDPAARVDRGCLDLVGHHVVHELRVGELIRRPGADGQEEQDDRGQDAQIEQPVPPRRRRRRSGPMALLARPGVARLGRSSVMDDPSGHDGSPSPLGPQ